MRAHDDFSRYAEIIKKEHLPVLEKALSKIPDFSWLLEQPHSGIERLQGDLLTDVPTVHLDNDGRAKMAPFTVMVLNHSCDLPDDRLDFVTVAPIVDFKKYLESQRGISSPERLQGLADAIRRNNKTELFYLPSFGGFSDGGLALLHLACPISSNIYKNRLSRGNRVASFTQIGFYYFLIKLVDHIARIESDVNRH